MPERLATDGYHVVPLSSEKSNVTTVPDGYVPLTEKPTVPYPTQPITAVAFATDVFIADCAAEIVVDAPGS